MSTRSGINFQTKLIGQVIFQTMSKRSGICSRLCQHDLVYFPDYVNKILYIFQTMSTRSGIFSRQCQQSHVIYHKIRYKFQTLSSRSGIFSRLCQWDQVYFPDYINKIRYIFQTITRSKIIEKSKYSFQISN